MIGRSKPYSKRMLIMVWAILLLCASGPLSAAAAKSVEAEIAKDTFIKLNGETLKMAEPIRKVDDRLFVPVAVIADIFGAKKISWNNDNEEATIHTAYGDKIVLGNGVPVVYFNEVRYKMDAEPFLMNGRLYIPVRHVAELLHATVTWNGAEKTAELNSVEPAVVTAEYGLDEISKEYKASKAELLKRNGLASESAVKEGSKLRVVIPSIFDHEAAPYTEQDYTLLAKITMVEAGYESYEGQLAVANVILNRVKDSRFPSTIRDVIYSGKQFPPAHNGLLDKSVPNASVLRAAKDALNGKNNVKDAIYFFNPKVSKGEFWSSLSVIVTIGHHSFAK